MIDTSEWSETGLKAFEPMDDIEADPPFDGHIVCYLCKKEIIYFTVANTEENPLICECGATYTIERTESLLILTYNK